MSKKKPMQWEVKKLDNGKWGIFLQQQFCKTDEPVCYGASINETVAKYSAERMNQDAIKELGYEEGAMITRRYLLSPTLIGRILTLL